MTVRIYTKSGCAYSAGAKRLLDEKGIAYEEIDVARDPARRAELNAAAGENATVPQIFFGDRHVGGYAELQELDRTRGVRSALGDGTPS